VESDRFADTAELTLAPGEEQSAWGLVTERVELQPISEDEAVLDVDEEDADDIQAYSDSETDVEPEEKSATTSESAGKRSGRSIEAIKAGIIGAINPENLKPVDPNSFQDQP
jgi:hypothetical protein